MSWVAKEEEGRKEIGTSKENKTLNPFSLSALEKLAGIIAITALARKFRNFFVRQGFQRSATMDRQSGGLSIGFWSKFNSNPIDLLTY